MKGISGNQFFDDIERLPLQSLFEFLTPLGQGYVAGQTGFRQFSLNELRV